MWAADLPFTRSMTNDPQFRDLESALYCDSIHYSAEGNRVLARHIVTRAKELGLLKF